MVRSSKALHRQRLRLETLEERCLLHGDFDLLVFSKTAGFRHDSIDEGVATIQALAVEHEFNVTVTEDAAVFTDAGLATFDAVVFLNTTGDILNAAQQTAFERFIQGGGGFVGVHAAADTEYSWAWYGELVGAYFQSHPPGTSTATVRVLDEAHPSSAGLPKEWVRTDEWYNFSTNPRGDAHVLATLDEGSYSGGSMGTTIRSPGVKTTMAAAPGTRDWATPREAMVKRSTGNICWEGLNGRPARWKGIAALRSNQTLKRSCSIPTRTTRWSWTSPATAVCSSWSVAAM